MEDAQKRHAYFKARLSFSHLESVLDALMYVYHHEEEYLKWMAEVNELIGDLDVKE